MKNLIEKIIEIINSLLSEPQSTNIKPQKRAIKKLYGSLKNEFIVSNLNDFITHENVTIKYGDLLEICNCSFYEIEIEHLRKMPGVSYRNYWNNLDKMWLDIDPETFRNNMKKNGKIFESFVDEFGNINDFYESNGKESFNMLLFKYEDTFNNLCMTIDEINEGSKLDYENKNLIRTIIKNFINEFNSLKAVYEEREQLDKSAVKTSLKSRLEDELEFVNKIKTDWNSSTL